MSRTPQQLRHHYEVERAIAARLKQSTREERRRMYSTMYQELFAEVPDHPRLTRRQDREATRRYTENKLNLVAGALGSDRVFAEFGPGDCEFAARVCARVKQVHGIDVSDQRQAGMPVPANFQLIVYDGYTVPLPPDSVDVAFSDMLIEHLHPEDTLLHLQNVHRILRPGGVYLFRAPHAMSGPWDVSRHFSDRAEGFHLKEWTYSEFFPLVRDTGFQACRSFWVAKGFKLRLPNTYFSLGEHLLGVFPAGIRRRLARGFAPVLCMELRK